MPELYIKYRGDKPVAYRYGEEIEATKLWIDGGYPTPEAAKEAWARSQRADTAFCLDCDKHQPYRVEKRRINSFIKDIPFEYDELYGVCVGCGNEVYVRELNDQNVDAINRCIAKERERLKNERCR